MEWIEVFVATSQIGLEPVEGVLYQCGLTGLMIHDEADFAEFLENPNREWDYVADGGKGRTGNRNYLFPARQPLRQRTACTDSGRIGGSEGK